ncbi:ATP-binding cassette domain-containing protein [Flavobacteriaceae bacterium]|jgi:phospholipid/cholesterol/gamma-HCH transport system ATP-binding protein|uniref:ABC transporter ATP-binding protein n=1 Tax=Candidatus Arcticimaribacter forsetii TaxID=2820661 RepID=UPI0020771A4F|nr:ATP-binding cassette domain-containing protein [Candidatus Arcticimaribacter forsetii]MCH1539795.1 ATP-binding cassette domain-containing protein [Flavobacteriaceae bacterium]MDA8639459.1 ATP-binding cassette domain-containing protein [Flavobacteriaceae bacterium]MDA8698778.1 ATP-binding cassette domain-containing protein [Flavobacteriaceae bacterium]MDB2325789.1 ATP-binding cassette domain-containing protein [Flavobacteriaceae bacterium]MDB2346192.1 ATP-binding cassette domain-containing p
MIEIKNLVKSFDETQVLKGISTTFEKGKTNLIIGQSGSGKTVFLKSILGLFEADSGEIIFGNTSLKSMDLKERALLRQEIGMVFQGSALFDSMNVEENIMFPMRMFTTASEEEIRERANTVINRVNLVNANLKLPSEISGGMKKRVAIARAIIMNPKYLFCDEPNSGLDPRTAILIDNLIQEITREYEITTVINTHDMNSVMEIGEKIVFLENGFKEWEGTNQEIFKTDNESVTKFVYSSEMFKKIRKIYIDESI